MSKQKILVIAAHPDDEVLGCGASIAKHSENGDEVHVMIMSEGISSRYKEENNETREAIIELAKCAEKANEVLGVKSLKLNTFPDNRMDGVDLLDVIHSIEDKIKEIKPNIIYTHHYGDVNVDHQTIYNAVITAARPLPGQCVKTILTFEVPSSTEWRPAIEGKCFKPNWFVNIDNFLDKKIQALKHYKSEMREWPHPRSYESVKHMASFRGSHIGCRVAEAFEVVRTII